MNGMKIAIGKRPNYLDGQLLLKDDFLEEQKYHIDARRRHNLVMHDWGVVRGLAVTRAHDKSVRIGPGAAIDESGREIIVDDYNVVDLDVFGHMIGFASAWCMRSRKPRLTPNGWTATQP